MKSGVITSMRIRHLPALLGAVAAVLAPITQGYAQTRQPGVFKSKPDRKGFYTVTRKDRSGVVTVQLWRVDRKTGRKQYIRPVPVYPRIADPVVSIAPRALAAKAQQAASSCLTVDKIRAGTITATGDVTGDYTGARLNQGLLLFRGGQGEWTLLLSNRPLNDPSGCWDVVVSGTDLRYQGRLGGRNADNHPLNKISFDEEQAKQACLSYREAVRLESAKTFGTDITGFNENCFSLNYLNGKRVAWNGFGKGRKGSATKLYSMATDAYNFALYETNGQGATVEVLSGKNFKYSGVLENRFNAERDRIAAGNKAADDRKAALAAARQREQAAIERERAARLKRASDVVAANRRRALQGLAAKPLSYRGITLGKTSAVEAVRLLSKGRYAIPSDFKRQPMGGGMDAYCSRDLCVLAFEGKTIGIADTYISQSATDHRAYDTEFSSLARRGFGKSTKNVGRSSALTSDKYYLSSIVSTSWSTVDRQSVSDAMYGRKPSVRTTENFFWKGRICLTAIAFNSALTDWDLCRK